MRRSSVVIMLLMLVAFGAMLAAAGSALQPLKQDAEAARFLTRLLGARGDLAEGTRVRAFRQRGGEDRLAPDGIGLVVRFTPSEEVLRHPGGMQAAVLRVCQEALQAYSESRLAWIEVDLEVPGTAAAPEEVRTLVAVTPEGLEEPAPALPAAFGRP